MFAQTFPDVPQVACFDTAFYADVTEEEYLFVIPKSLLQEGERCYGFDCLSYQYVMEALQSCRAGATRAAYPLCLVLIDLATHGWQTCVTLFSGKLKGAIRVSG